MCTDLLYIHLIIHPVKNNTRMLSTWLYKLISISSFLKIGGKGLSHKVTKTLFMLDVAFLFNKVKYMRRHNVKCCTTDGNDHYFSLLCIYHIHI